MRQRCPSGHTIAAQASAKSDGTVSSGSGSISTPLYPLPAPASPGRTRLGEGLCHACRGVLGARASYAKALAGLLLPNDGADGAGANALASVRSVTMSP